MDMILICVVAALPRVKLRKKLTRMKVKKMDKLHYIMETKNEVSSKSNQLQANEDLLKFH